MDRIEKIKNILAEKGLDFAVINGAASIKYFTGFSFSDDTTYLVVNVENSYLIVNELNEAYSKSMNVKKYGSTEELAEILIDIILDNSKVGFCVDSYESFKFIEKILNDCKLIEIKEDLLKIQSIKETREIEMIKDLTTITKNAINYGFSKFEDGMTEEDVSIEIKNYIVSKGVDYSFCHIQADENSSIPHHNTDKTNIKRIVVMDVGASKDGYSSDITRTFLINPDEEMKKVYEIVKKAHQKAIEKIKPGVKAKEIDKVAKNIVESAGYRYIHSTGHGIGLNTKCGPKISKKSDDVLKENMIFTIEPGIYLSGKFGIRIEDVVLVKKNGYEIL